MFKGASLLPLRHLLQELNTSASKQILNIHTQYRPLQAGHSKWANIRHIKTLKDGQKATIFTKLSRQIRLAVQEGGSTDPALNSMLRSVVEEALRKNMPMGTIQNNIKKSQQNKTELKRHQVQIRYKQKVFAVCIMYTDNFLGLKMDMATILKRAGASFIEASHLFEDFGTIEANLTLDTQISKDDLKERAMVDAIECGAEEFEIISSETALVNFICNAIELTALRRSLENRGYKINNSEHVFVPKNAVKLTPEELTVYDAFLEKLRSLPGLEDVYDNIKTPENA